MPEQWRMRRTLQLSARESGSGLPGMSLRHARQLVRALRRRPLQSDKFFVVNSCRANLPEVCLQWQHRRERDRQLRLAINRWDLSALHLQHNGHKLWALFATVLGRCFVAEEMPRVRLLPARIPFGRWGQGQRKVIFNFYCQFKINKI